MSRCRQYFAALLLTLVADAAPAAAAAPFLWQVQGATTTHYLMGSVHLLPESAYPLPPALEQAYASADSLVFETDPAALSDPQMQMQMLSQGQAPRGLESQIGAPMMRRVREHIAGKGLPENLCDAFKAWFCALTLEVMSFEQSEYRPELGLEIHFYRLASAGRRKPLRWLEEVAEQMQFFTGMPEVVGEEMLQGALDEESSDGGSPEELLKAWQDNDIAGMEKLVSEFRRTQPKLYERLLAARNRAWLPRLAGLFKGPQRQLIIVGAAHLVGPDGLVAQLKARGFKVTPAKPEQWALR